MAESLTVGEGSPYLPTKPVHAELHQDNPCIYHSHRDPLNSAALVLSVNRSEYLKSLTGFKSDHFDILATMDIADQAGSLFQALIENGHNVYELLDNHAREEDARLNIILPL